jgi:hypothetical protein
VTAIAILTISSMRSESMAISPTYTPVQ